MRNHEFKIRLDDQERATLDGLARAHGLPAAAYIRAVVLEKPPEPIRQIPQINRQCYAELGRISGNLQRLWTWATTDKRLPPDFSKVLSEALKSLKTATNTTQRAVLGADRD